MCSVWRNKSKNNKHKPKPKNQTAAISPRTKRPAVGFRERVKNDLLVLVTTIACGGGGDHVKRQR